MLLLIVERIKQGFMDADVRNFYNEKVIYYLNF